MMGRALVVMSLVIALCGIVMAKEIEKVEGKAFRAKIVKVDGKRITTGGRTSGEARAVGVTFEVDDKTVITVGGRAGKLEDVKEGMQATITLTADEKVATKIDLDKVAASGGRDAGRKEAGAQGGVAFRAFVVKVEGQTVTVQQRAGKAAAEPVKFEVDDQTVITIEGKLARAGDLAANMEVDVTLDGERKKALAINFEANRSK